MAIPSPGHFCRWILEPQDEEEAAKFNANTVKLLQTMNVELAENLAEFQFAGGGDSGVLLNTPDYWQLRGRRSLVLELLQKFDEVSGTAKPPADSEDS
jgi:hypothetical protein